MHEFDRSLEDTVITPTFEQMQSVGNRLLTIIRRDLATDKIRGYGYSPDDPFGIVPSNFSEVEMEQFNGRDFLTVGAFRIFVPSPEDNSYLFRFGDEDFLQGWLFTINGAEDLIDQDGFKRDPTISVYRQTSHDNEKTRSFILATTKSTTDDRILQLYRFIFRKNTEYVEGVYKAEITRDTLAEMVSSRDELVNRLMGGDPEVVVRCEEDPDSILESHVYDMRDNVETQLMFFECDMMDILEVDQLLERAGEFQIQMEIYDPTEREGD